MCKYNGTSLSPNGLCSMEIMGVLSKRRNPKTRLRCTHKVGQWVLRRLWTIYGRVCWEPDATNLLLTLGVYQFHFNFDFMAVSPVNESRKLRTLFSLYSNYLWNRVISFFPSHGSNFLGKISNMYRQATRARSRRPCLPLPLPSNSLEPYA